MPIPRGYGVRLFRIGCNNRPFYLIGAMHKKVPVGKKPNKRPDEVIGSVDPLPNEYGEHVVACDLNRLSYYLGMGATPSKLLSHYLGLAGFLPLPPKLFINAWRHNENKPSRRGLRPLVHPSFTVNHEDMAEKRRLAKQAQQPTSDDDHPPTTPANNNLSDTASASAAASSS